MKIWIQVAVLVAAMTAFGAHAKGKKVACKKHIEKACKSAGFKKHKDCFNKVIAGESVPGVSVDPSDVSACKKHGH